MTCKKQAETGRDAQGRFQRGVSGNPSGRPVGASYRGLVAARRWAEEKGLQLLMELGENGDADAIRFLVSLGIPKQKPVSLPEPLPGTELSSPERQNLAEQARAVLAAALHGELGPDAAAMHMALLAQAARVEEITELKTEVERLGRLLDGRK